MRLIDADKIKQSVTNEMLKAELNSPIYCTLECVIADIDKQPTAYGMNKVIEQINNLDIKAIPRYKGGAFGDYEGMDYYIKKSDVLEILKAGLMQ